MSEPLKKPAPVPEDYGPGIPPIMGLSRERQGGGWPQSFVLPDRSTAPSFPYAHICPGYAPFANEFAYFMEYSGNGYGFEDMNGWRCDINYTVADVLSGHATNPASAPVSQDGLARLYRAAGFSPQRLCGDPSSAAYASEEQMKEAIRRSLLALGQPVILSPVSHAFFGAIVVGYERGGEALVTYSYPPYFAAPNNCRPEIRPVERWYGPGTALTLPGERRGAFAVQDVYLHGFRQMRRGLAEGVLGEGLKVYEGWKRFLRLSVPEMIAEVRRTRAVPGADIDPDMLDGALTDEKAMAGILTLVDPTWCNLAERRYYVQNFCRQAKAHFPGEAEALSAMVKHFWATSNIMGSDYVREAGHDPVNAEAFAAADVRERMAECVELFQQGDRQGLQMVEALLSRIDG